MKGHLINTYSRHGNPLRSYSTYSGFSNLKVPGVSRVFLAAFSTLCLLLARSRIQNTTEFNKKFNASYCVQFLEAQVQFQCPRPRDEQHSNSRADLPYYEERLPHKNLGDNFASL
jgi:hypothetical protein